MLTNVRLFWILFAFFAFSDVLYVVWSLNDPINPPRIEWVGSVALGLSAILSALIAFYLARVHKSQGGELPEDRGSANIDDGEAEQGFFSPWSWWPIMLAAGAALLFLGIAMGVWIAFIGAAVTGVSLVGWIYEYYRGNFGR